MGALEASEIGSCAQPIWDFRGKFGTKIISFRIDPGMFICFH
jgi:hypothetical protein